MDKKIKSLAINAISITLVLLFTSFINIRLPFMGNGGLIHLGNVPLFLVAIIFGRKTGFISGAVGMALFDFIGGWNAWMPFTFIIVGAMGYSVGYVAERQTEYKKIYYTFAMFIALCLKVIGYYIAEVILYGNYFTPLGSVMGNILQIAIAMLIVLPIVEPIRKVINKII